MYTVMEDINSRDLFLACHFSPEMVCVVLTKNFAPEAVSVLDGRYRCVSRGLLEFKERATTRS